MERGSYRPSSSDRGQRKACVLKLCADQTFPALFEEKEPFLPKKNEKTSTSLRNRGDKRDPPLPPQAEGTI